MATDAKSQPAGDNVLLDQPIETNSPAKSSASATTRESRAHGSGLASNPFRNSSDSSKQGASIHSRQLSKDSIGNESPRQSHVPAPKYRDNYREQAFAAHSEAPSPTRERRSVDAPRKEHVPSASGHVRRVSSLKERFPGDKSVTPLDTIKKETKLAHRAPHLKAKHIPSPDTIDKLDDAFPGRLRYHHEGPYDAALLARNTSYDSSPVAALKHSNEEAIKATPADKIKDSLQDHRPLDGTATYPPGTRDPLGNTYDYQEGDDMMIVDGGDFQRWPGVKYTPDDLEGRGEPGMTSYAMGNELQTLGDRKAKHKQERYSSAIELEERPKNSPTGSPQAAQSYTEWESERRSSGGFGNEVKRRFGSLRGKSKN